jgi:hypothetical protein
MGDMADDVIDMIYSRDVFDEEEAEVECKYCGKEYLWWQEVGGRYVLFESRKNGNFPHKCNRGLSKKAILDSFSDID